MVQKSSVRSASTDFLFLFLRQSEQVNMFENNWVFFKINAFINVSFVYWFLSATAVLHGEHSANMFSLAKIPPELHTQ